MVVLNKDRRSGNLRAISLDIFYGRIMSMDVMGLIFKYVGKDPRKLALVVQWYLAHTEAVHSAIALYEKEFKNMSSDVPPVPEPVPPPPTGDSDSPVVYSLKTRVLFIERADGRPDDGSAAQVGDRIHFDITPFDKNGVEIGPGDPRIAQFLKKVGDIGAPALDLRWGYRDRDGKFVMCWNSTDREDPWALQSYNAPGKGRDNDNGFTPVLQVESPLGPGVFHPVLWPVVNAADNGGLALSGPEISWLND